MYANFTKFFNNSRDARDSTYSSEPDLRAILESSGGGGVSSISRPAHPDFAKLPRCYKYSVENAKKNACVCSLPVCVDWYPCALKYCRNREGDGEHRCGIKTCRKCTTYRFPVRTKKLCMWDSSGA